MSTEKAKALLGAASLKHKCDDMIRRQGCKSCDEWWPIVLPALRELERLGFKIKSLAWAISAARALEVAHDFCCDFEEDRPCTKENCQVQAALTDWEEMWAVP